jgi:hypothetical protein
MTFSWLHTDAVKDAFAAQLKHYGVDEPFDHLNMFWNPRAGAWQSFDADAWRITKAGLAKSDSLLGLAPAVYEEITAQWAQMPTDIHQKAIWDPRERQWVLAEPKGPNGSSKKTAAQVELERELNYLKSLLDEGKITPAEYQSAVQQTLSRYLNPPASG